MTINNNYQHGFYQLDPDTILDALESVGVFAEAALLPLNSYENRVYQFKTEDGQRMVTKFYRPNRWSNEQILEEHQFCFELEASEIPIVAPLKFKVNGESQSLLTFQNFRFAVFESRGGRHPNLDDNNVLTWIGRFLARIHNVGATRAFKHRPTLSIQEFGFEQYRFLSERQFIPSHLKQAMDSVCLPLLEQINQSLTRFKDLETIRLHADCHPSNILWTDDGPHFVDLDDSRSGPAVQDLWMLITGDEYDQPEQRNALLDGYEEFREFDDRQWYLVEALRGLRMINYMGWLARRWDDPSFQHHFPWFNQSRYWEEQLLQLKEQLGAIQNQPTVFNWQ